VTVRGWNTELVGVGREGAVDRLLGGAGREVEGRRDNECEMV
jgi:hypothetical protein